MNKDKFVELVRSSFETQRWFDPPRFSDPGVSDFVVEIYPERYEDKIHERSIIASKISLGTQIAMDDLRDFPEDMMKKIAAEKAWRQINKEFRSVDNLEVAYLCHHLNLNYAKVRHLLADLDINVEG